MRTRFGRVVELVREKADPGCSFSVGLEAIEPGTGGLVADPVTDYEGSGVAFQAGDLLFGKLRPYLAKAWLADRDGAAVGDFHVYRPTDKARPGYLRWVLLARSFLDPVESSVFGAKMPRADWEFIRNVEIHVPPASEQRAIADYLDRETARIGTLIEEQRRLIEMLLERRASVISSALTPSPKWARRRIKHLGETSLGKMLDAGRAVRTRDELRPYVRAADVRADGSVNLSDLNEMPFSDTEMEMFDLRAGDVLLIEGGATVGRPGFVWESARGIAFQKTVNRLRVDRHTDPRFVYWSMLRLYESSYYANHYGAVSFVHLTREKLREIELELPNLGEQQRIALYLDDQTTKIDELIAESERFIELSRERRAALITAAVTGQLDVREVA